MIGYIKGELADISEECILVDNNGIGYQIHVAVSVMNELPPIGEEIKIYTWLHVREDILDLYGFLTRDDLFVFKLLIKVNGIGPRGALGILSVISPDELRYAVLSDDTKAISRAPGIGPKTAGRLVLELKDKLRLEDVFERQTGAEKPALSVKTEEGKDIRQDAAAALVALGYSGTEALKAVRQVEISEGMDTEDVLKLSLKKISRF